MTLESYKYKYDLPLSTLRKQIKANKFYDGWKWNGKELER